MTMTMQLKDLITYVFMSTPRISEEYISNHFMFTANYTLTFLVKTTDAYFRIL